MLRGLVGERRIYGNEITGTSAYSKFLKLFIINMLNITA